MHSVYVLKSKKDKKFYIGYSNDVNRRIVEHNKGKVDSTRNRTPMDLIYCESYVNRKDAMQREKYFKTGWGRQYIRKILQNTLSE